MEYRALGNSNLDDGTVKGDRREAACMAWFPAGRELYPVSVKFKGDDGEVQDVALIFYARPSRWEIVFRPRQ